MSSKNKKKGRRAYLEDFRKDSNGNYVYCGILYEYTGSSRVKFNIALALLTLVALVSATVCGVLPAKGMLNTAYVLAFYVLELIAVLLLSYKAVRLLIAKDPIREYVFTKTVKRIPVYSMAAAVCAAARLIGYTVFVIITAAREDFFGTQTGYFITLVLLDLFVIASTVAVFVISRKYGFRPAEKRTVKQDEAENK